MSEKVGFIDSEMSREFGGQKQMQNTLKTLYLKRKITNRERIVIDYLTAQNNYIPVKQIAKETGFDYRSTVNILNNLYIGSLIFKKVQKFHQLAINGGRKFEMLFKVDSMAIACLPPIHCIHNKSKKVNSIIKLMKKNKDLMTEIFN